MIKRLCLIGSGLIGGSFALALKRANAVEEIVAYDRNYAAAQRACELNVADRAESELAKAVEHADVIVLAVPMGAMAPVLKALAPLTQFEQIITDVGSAKARVVEDAVAAYGSLPARFVPGHPIAGTERSGVDAAFAELFQNRKTILTPLAETDEAAIEVVTQLWQSAGAQVVKMDVEHHDEVLAATSHLPHFLAYTLVASLVRMDDSEEIFCYAAGGFRDFTRIASSDPSMWHDICLANKDKVLKLVEHFESDLSALRQALESGHSEEMLKVFSTAKAARDRFAQLFDGRKNQDN